MPNRLRLSSVPPGQGHQCHHRWHLNVHRDLAFLPRLPSLLRALPPACRSRLRRAVHLYLPPERAFSPQGWRAAGHRCPPLHGPSLLSLTRRPVSPPAASGAWTLPSEQLPQTAPGTELGAAPGGHIGVSPRLSGGAGVTSHVSPEYRWLHPPRLGRERQALKGKTRRRPGGALPVAH